MRRTFLLLLAGLLATLVPPVAFAERPRPGDIPPDALGVDGDGKPVTVSQHRGKVVIVTFWASWCGPCRRELPMLAHVQKTVGRDHLEVIAINLNEPRRDFAAVVRANRKQFDLTYIHDKGETADLYGVESVPNMFIIGTDGVVEHTHVGYGEDMLQSFVGEMLDLLPPDVLARPAGR